MSHGQLANCEGIAFGMDGDLSTYFHFILVKKAHYYILKHVCWNYPLKRYDMLHQYACFNKYSRELRFRRVAICEGIAFGVDGDLSSYLLIIVIKMPINIA